MYNVMCIHLDNIPKKLNIYRLVRIFLQKRRIKCNSYRNFLKMN